MTFEETRLKTLELRKQIGIAQEKLERAKSKSLPKAIVMSWTNRIRTLERQFGELMGRLDSGDLRRKEWETLFAQAASA